MCYLPYIYEWIEHQIYNDKREEMRVLDILVVAELAIDAGVGLGT